MRLFLIEWSGKEQGMIDIVKRLKEQSHEIVYWSGCGLDSQVNKSEFPNTIFHEYGDARAGISSPQVDDSSFEPPSESLIKKLYETESTILIMMNKRFEWMSENQKKHLYYRYIQYWDGVIKKYKPEAIIGPSAPHTVYDLVLFGLAKLYGIKTIMFELTAIYDRSITMKDFAIGCDPLKKQLIEDQNRNFSVSDLELDIRKYYDNQINPEESSTPGMIKVLGSAYSPKNIMKAKSTAVFRSLRDKNFVERVGNRLLRFGKGNLKKEYESLQVKPDYSKKYIYMPLHYQPECSTSPLGGIFADQILAIEILSYCLPDDWVIYVKEQPFQWKPRGTIYFSYRYKGYYESIAKLKNVKIVPIDTDTFSLIENAQAEASVGGTAPWEGVLRGKPGIIFSHPWYQDCHGIFKVQDVESCKKAINNIVCGFKIDKRKIINFLVSFQKVALNGFRAPHMQGMSPINVEQNIENHLRMINTELL